MTNENLINKGISLREIIQKLGNKNYPVIMCRCLWELNGEVQDDLFGYCSYENGKLQPLDGDSYSLDDLYIKWEEYDEDGDINLCVYERGDYSE